MHLAAAARTAMVAAPSTIVSSLSLPMFVDLCASMAPFAAVFVFAAPFPTIQKIKRDKSVGTLPLLPYSSMTASAFLWTTYGLLRRESNIWSCNVIGLVLGLFYMVKFIRLSPKALPTLPGTVRQHVQAVLAIVTATLLLALSPLTNPAGLIGPVGVLLTIAMFASPLSALKTVLQTKSAASIPLPFTLASLTNCFLWSVAGVLKYQDANIYVPNLLGLTFSAAQAGLKLFYGNGPKAYAPEVLPM
jgi:solute carrier family 50 protein (sugar transporter)